MIVYEFRRLVLALVVIAVLSPYLIPGHWWLLFAVLAVLAVTVFREPVRKVPAEPLGVISPIDGRVLNVEPCEDDWLKRPALAIRIRQGWLRPLVTRFPVEGKLQRSWFDARHTFCEAERRIECAQFIQTDEQDDVIVAFVAHPYGVSHYRAQPGERVGQGQRAGLVAFNREVIVLFPAGSAVKVESGDRVRAGESILGLLVHNG